MNLVRYVMLMTVLFTSPALAQNAAELVSPSSVLIFCVVVMFLAGIGFVHMTLKRQNQGFGPSSIKAMGILLFIPLLVFSFGYAEIPGEAVTALLGTLAGYLFSPTATEKPNT